MKGEIDFGIGDAPPRTAAPGTLVHLPAGTIHWFRFGEGGGEMISMTSRLGASEMFTEMAREIAPVNPDLAEARGGRRPPRDEAGGLIRSEHVAKR